MVLRRQKELNILVLLHFSERAVVVEYSVCIFANTDKDYFYLNRIEKVTQCKAIILSSRTNTIINKTNSAVLQKSLFSLIFKCKWQLQKKSWMTDNINYPGSGHNKLHSIKQNKEYQRVLLV